MKSLTIINKVVYKFHFRLLLHILIYQQGDVLGFSCSIFSKSYHKVIHNAQHIVNCGRLCDVIVTEREEQRVEEGNNEEPN